MRSASAFFWLRGKIPVGYKVPLVAALLLGGLQGFVGWFMVQSGLQPGMAAVSPYRLAMHLGLALLLYAAALYSDAAAFIAGTFPDTLRKNPSLRLHARVGLVLLCLAMIMGAFTAGLEAGKNL